MDFDVDYYPSQTIECIGGVTFSSTFDSGNLKQVRKESCNKYILTICNDTGINGKITNYKTWFHFSVEGIDDASLVTFIGLFRDGMQPVFRTSNEWQRVRYPCQYRLLPDGQFEVTFQHLFYKSQQNSTKVYFAFSYPWSNQENSAFMEQMISQSKQQIKDLYIKCHTLGYSKERRPINLLTITTNSNSTNKMEEPFANAFPESSESRPLIFKKRYIFVSARVHPGEVPGSFVLNGIIKFLLNPNDKAAEIARNEFVWVIVPIINPDGVYRGHYRTDSLCQNLNRYYLNPVLSDHPAIFVIKEYILRLHNTERLYAYLDLHAHAGHKGIFIFGNQLPNLYMHTQSCLLPKLIGLYSEIFDYDGCNFTEKNMYAADKGDGLSKEGSGRVALYKETNIIFSYTLECNYNTGKVSNILPKASFLSDQEDILNTYGNESIDESIVIGTQQITTTNKTYFYTISDYEQVGKGIVLAFLDVNLLNPCSRIPESQFKTLANLKSHLAYNIMKTMHFRFEGFLRKVLKYAHIIIRNLNNKEQIQRTLKSFFDYLKSNIIKDNLELLEPPQIKQAFRRQLDSLENQKQTVQVLQRKIEKLPEIQSRPQQKSQETLTKNRNRSEGKNSVQPQQTFQRSFKIKKNGTKVQLY